MEIYDFRRKYKIRHNWIEVKIKHKKGDCAVGDVSNIHGKNLEKFLSTFAKLCVKFFKNMRDKFLLRVEPNIFSGRILVEKGTLKIIVIIVSVVLVVSLVANIFLFYQQSNETSENGELVALQNQLNSLETTYQNYVDTHTYSNVDYNNLGTSHENYVSQHSHSDSEFNSVQSQVTDLQTELIALENIHQNYVSEHSYLDSEYSALQSQSDDLENQIMDLQTQVTDIQNQLNEKTQDYIELQQDYDDLLSDYTLINGPASTFDTIDDLEITLITDRTIYDYTDSLSGNVSIYYVNGTAFEGTFKIGIDAEFGTAGGVTIGTDFDVNGDGDFIVNPPNSFKYGPGTYSVYLVIIENLDGYIVASGHELSDNIRVLVEAK